MVKPGSAGIVFGVFALSFFIHNAVMTIMRSAAKPANNTRDLNVAFFLTWICYASMGVLTCVCPPLGDVAALSSPQAKSGIFTLEQPPAMAPMLVLGRLALLVQSITVYPILLFIVRSQLFTAFVYKRAYPGPLPTLGMTTAQAAVTTLCTVLGVDIPDVLKFAGALGGLVCCFGIPGLIHAKVHYKAGSLTPVRAGSALVLIAFGIFCVAFSLI